MAKTREEINAIQLKRYHKKYKNDPVYIARARKRARQQHAEVGTKWYHENKERASVLNKAWIKRNKEEFKQYCVQWRRNNLPKLCINASAYRAQKIKATPSWINHEAVEKFYEQSAQLTKETGTKYTLDHMVPLNSEFVCGLHVENNLQILTLEENSSKNCLTWPQQEWNMLNSKEWSFDRDTHSFGN